LRDFDFDFEKFFVYLFLHKGKYIYRGDTVWRVWVEWDCLLLCRSLSHIYLFVILFKVELMQVTLSIVIIVIRMINNLTRLKTKKQQQ